MNEAGVNGAIMNEAGVSRTIVLLHGLGRSRASMMPLAARLTESFKENQKGNSRESPTENRWTVRRLGYPSTRLTLDDAVETVRQALPAGPLLLVGHSLGGLIAAALLRRPGTAAIDRVVQLGAPNAGTPLAGRVGGLGLVRYACGPAMADIAALTDAPPADNRIGAIAGTAGWLIPGTGLTPPHDGAVTVGSAIAGAGHCARVPILHTLLPASARAARLTAAFLRDGHFPRER
ncbi:MAG: alpha/beta fold hydrolase [Pseudomonadota bacterium]